jgi:Domain of unknown function (DUF4272)
MKNCSLFLPIADDQVLHDVIVSAFSDARVDITGKPHDWQNISVTYKKGWFGRSMIIIHKRSFQYQGEEFANMMSGMLNFIGQIPAQNENIKFKFITQVQGIMSSLGIVSDGSYDMFEAGIFKILAVLGGFAFTDGSNFLDHQKNLILNTAGHSTINDLSNIKDNNVRLGMADASDTTELTLDQIQRKEKSMQTLIAKNIPVLSNLPCVESEEETDIRTTEDICKRMIAVAICAIKGEGVDAEIVKKVMEQFGAASFFSPKEAIFIADHHPDDQHRANFAWRYECLWLLLWALGYIEELDFPDHICNVPEAVGFIRDQGSLENLIKNANPRSKSAILDEADLIYRMNGACTSARIKNQPAPANMDAGVVYERHYALNWLIRYQNQDWDSVSADT